MNDITYRTELSKISEQRMQFTVIHRHPEYPKEKKKTVKSDVEIQLIALFNKNTPINQESNV